MSAVAENKLLERAVSLTKKRLIEVEKAFVRKSGGATARAATSSSHSGKKTGKKG